MALTTSEQHRNRKINENKKRKAADHSEYPSHRVLFTKWQIMVGAVLLNIGRTESGSTWVVSKIVTYPTGRIRSRSVNRVAKMDDTIYLSHAKTGEQRVIKFASLTYSAAWEIHNYRATSYAKEMEKEAELQDAAD